jgi:hypothetical protein
MESDVKNLEITMAEFKTDMWYIKKSLIENAEDHKELKKMIIDFIDSSEKRFANKWVEKFLLWAASIIWFAILWGVITLLVETFLHIN